MGDVVTEFVIQNWQLIILFIVLIILFNLFITELFYWLSDTIKTKIEERVIVTPYSKKTLIPLTITYMSAINPEGITWQTQIPFTTDQTKIRQALEKDLKDKVIAYDFREEI